MLPKSLTKINKEMQKKFGSERIMMAYEGIPPTQCLTTGSPMLDMAIRKENGGLPVGRQIEIYGQEAGGKTSISLLAIAEAQRYETSLAEKNPEYQERLCLFLDAEHTFDPTIAEGYGVDLEKLIYINSKTAEESLDIMDVYIRSGIVRLCVVDSVPALTPAKVNETSMEQQTMALLARLMSTITMKLNGALAENDASVIWINQVRETMKMYGNPETTPGGRALKFYSSLRLKVSRGEDIKDGNTLIGHVVKINCAKNKTGGEPKKVAQTEIIYGLGYSKETEVFNLAVEMGIIHKGGAWYSLIDEETGELININGMNCKFQGKDNAVQAMYDEPLFYEEVKRRLDGEEIELKEEDIPEDD